MLLVCLLIQLSSSPEEKTQVDTFNSSLASLISSGGLTSSLKSYLITFENVFHLRSYFCVFNIFIVLVRANFALFFLLNLILQLLRMMLSPPNLHLWTRPVHLRNGQI